MDLTEKTLSSTSIFDGVVVKLKVDEVELPNGHHSKREVVVHPGGVCVLPLADDGTVTLVSQYRYPIGREVLELPAGKLDGPEDHRIGAIRELSEETGFEAGELIYLGSILSSPGFSTEVLHMYLGRHLKQGAQHPDDDEFLKLRTMPFDQLLRMILSGEMDDGKTVATALKAKYYLEQEKKE